MLSTHTGAITLRSVDGGAGGDTPAVRSSTRVRDHVVRLYSGVGERVRVSNGLECSALRMLQPERDFSRRTPLVGTFLVGVVAVRVKLAFG